MDAGHGAVGHPVRPAVQLHREDTQVYVVVAVHVAVEVDVRGGGTSSASRSSELQPSSNGSSAVASNRTFGLKVAPRPL